MVHQRVMQRRAALQQRNKGTNVDAGNSILTLDEAASGTATDKFSAGHFYQRFYESAFALLRKQPVRLLEIGVRDGSSLKVWTRYFLRYEHIYGLAYGASENYEGHLSTLERVTVFYGDQSSSESLDNLVNKSGGSFDLVIDDGSHVPWHILFSFYKLFPAVKPGGLYVVEDTETSYWNAPGASIYGYFLNNTGTGISGNVLEFFGDLTHVINGRIQNSPHLMLFSRVEHEISSIEFADNCILIRKGFNSFHRHRPYSLAHMVDVQVVEQWQAEKVAKYRTVFPALVDIEQSHRNYIPFGGDEYNQNK
eukprot:gene2012-2700_t